MKKITLVLVLFLIVVSLSAQKNSLKLKAYQRYHISGLPPTPVLEVGGKETVARRSPSEPEYFIYLLTDKIPFLTIENVWIKRQSYLAGIKKLACKPVVLSNGTQTDTLVGYTDEQVWQISITGRAKKNSLPAKNISANVAGNDLVVRLHDKQGRHYTRSVKYIPTLESARRQ